MIYVLQRDHMRVSLTQANLLISQRNRLISLTSTVNKHETVSFKCAGNALVTFTTLGIVSLYFVHKNWV